MKALCSKFKNRVFWPNRRGAFRKRTFINVQKPFTAIRPDPNIFLLSFIFFNILLTFINQYHLTNFPNDFVFALFQGAAIPTHRFYYH